MGDWLVGRITTIVRGRDWRERARHVSLCVVDRTESGQLVLGLFHLSLINRDALIRSAGPATFDRQPIMELIVGLDVCLVLAPVQEAVAGPTFPTFVTEIDYALRGLASGTDQAQSCSSNAINRFEGVKGYVL